MADHDLNRSFRSKDGAPFVVFPHDVACYQWSRRLLRLVAQVS